MAQSGIALNGRTAVVTGAASGIGRALALALARRGCPVAICDQDATGLEETAASIGGPSLHEQIDVRDRQQMLAFGAKVRGWAPAPFGVVVNNAGVDASQTVADAALEDDQWVVDVNYGGVLNGTHAFLPALLEQGDGTLVNVSSVFGLLGWPTQSAYCASKFAVRGFTEALRHELRHVHGSRVHAVAVHPGGVKTNIVENARFHVDDRGNTDRDTAASQFHQVAQKTPEAAAEIIIRGVERGKSRIRVGADAVFLDLLVRVAPNRYYDVLKRLEPLVLRAAS